MSKDIEVHFQIAARLARRCSNCYQELPGYQVKASGWNWLTPNFGPVCDECFAEVAPFLLSSDRAVKEPDAQEIAALRREIGLTHERLDELDEPGKPLYDFVPQMIDELHRKLFALKKKRLSAAEGLVSSPEMQNEISNANGRDCDSRRRVPVDSRVDGSHTEGASGVATQSKTQEVARAEVSSPARPEVERYVNNLVQLVEALVQDARFAAAEGGSEMDEANSRYGKFFLMFGPSLLVVLKGPASTAPPAQD